MAVLVGIRSCEPLPLATFDTKWFSIEPPSTSIPMPVVSLALLASTIVPVDWELAAMGAPLYDLAFLADGFRPPDLDTLLDAYRRQADLEGLFVPDPEELRYLLGCFRLHKVLKSLSDSVLLGFSQKTVEKLMDTAERLGQRLMTP